MNPAPTHLPLAFLALALVLAGCVGASSARFPASKVEADKAGDASAQENATVENKTGLFPVFFDNALPTSASACVVVNETTRKCSPWVPVDPAAFVTLPIRNAIRAEVALSWVPSSPLTEKLLFAVLNKNVSSGKDDWTPYCYQTGVSPIMLDCELAPISSAESYVLFVIPLSVASEPTRHAWEWIVLQQPYHIEGSLTTTREPSTETS